jgi:hypothetical protein
MERLYVFDLFYCLVLQANGWDRCISGCIRAGNNRQPGVRANRVSFRGPDSGRFSPCLDAACAERHALGLASVKPHLGILVPVALIAARRWLTFAAAGGTLAILVIASGVAFGWSMWPLWLAKLFSHADWVADVKGRLNPTVTAGLMFLGVNPTAARIVQLCVATAVATIIWMCFRRGVTILATAALLVGTFLATPYAVVYDLPMVTSAVIAVLAEKSRTGTSLTILEAAVLSLALALPIIVMETWRLSAIKSIPLILLFGMIGWLIFHSNPAGSRAALSG